MHARKRPTRIATIAASLAVGLGAVALAAPELNESTQPMPASPQPAPAADSISDIYYFARGNDAFAGIDVDQQAQNGITIALADSASTQDRQRLHDDIVDRVPLGTTIDFQTCPTSLNVLQATGQAVDAALASGRLDARSVVTTEQGLCRITITTTKPLTSPNATDLRKLFPQPFVTIAQGPRVTFQSL